MEFRICKVCSQNKIITDFGINNSFSNGRIVYKYICKNCKCIQSRICQKLHKMNTKPTPGLCPICLKFTNKWVLDHDHDTNKFRGWLCNTCNVAIGKFNDDPSVLKRAIQYLEEV